jgi:multidrug efflux pump subunit AcrB
VSVIGTFIFMNALWPEPERGQPGRDLLCRGHARGQHHRRPGEHRPAHEDEQVHCQAALDGTREVWGAILASTLTTWPCFCPWCSSRRRPGQLFKDIAIAVTCAISLSLLVSVLVIPSITCQVFRFVSSVKPQDKGPLPRLGGFLAAKIMVLVRLAVRNWLTRVLTVTGLTAAAVLLAWLFFPKMDYLPQGNRNLVINILIPPPGLSYPERMDIGMQLHDASSPTTTGSMKGIREFCTSSTWARSRSCSSVR